VAELQFLTVGGVRTRIARSGSGDPLVLLHGGQFGDADALDAWMPIWGDLERSFSILAFDRLGQGHTDAPESEDGYAFDAVLNHIAEVLDACDITGAHLAGHSRGGLFAAALAQLRPDLVRTLVIVASGSLANNDDGRTVAFYREHYERVGEGPTTLEDARMGPVAQSFSTDHVTDEFAQALLEGAQLDATTRARAVMREMKPGKWDAEITARADAILREVDESGFAMPTAIIWGYNDPSAPVDLGTSLLQRIAPKTERLSLNVINRAGHYVYREQPAQFAAVIRAVCAGPS